MSRYLIKLYPVYPCDDYKIVNLDILKPDYDNETKNIGFNNIRGYVQQMYDIYQFAVERYGLDKHGITYYNNSIWALVEAENTVLASDIFKQKLEEQAKDHED